MLESSTEHVSGKLVTPTAWLIFVSLQSFLIPSHLYNVSVLLVSGKDETEASPLCDWEAGKDLERTSSTRLEARVPSHGSGAMTRSPSPLAWRPDFPGAPREAH